jgi:hypothetical protein
MHFSRSSAVSDWENAGAAAHSNAIEISSVFMYLSSGD